MTYVLDYTEFAMVRSLGILDALAPNLVIAAEMVPENSTKDWDWLWQGAILFVLGVFCTSIISFIKKTAPASFRSHIRAWKARQFVFRAQLNSSSESVRQDAATRILFNVLRYLIIAFALWLSSEILHGPFGNEITWYIGIFLKISSPFFLITAMRWVGVYYTSEAVSDGAIRTILMENEWVLCFNPPDSKKSISFIASGEIGRGKNSNEHSWNVSKGVLEIRNKDCDIYNKFIYSSRHGKFLSTDSPDVKAFKNQYIELSS